uniref:C3H1-type domain-containing protein n=1 Tax=Ganoderma boninense TaxID=34458 RepID=A0A5K1JW80_9APHY|nr:C3H1-type domain-containing protein [Ganoderma boninense]
MAPSTPVAHPFVPSTSANKCAQCKRGRGSTYHIMPAPRTPSPRPAFDPYYFPPQFDDPPDEADNKSDSDIASSADSFNEGVEAQILAEFEETTRILDELREFADTYVKSHPVAGFEHPLKYAMFLMKLGLTSLNTVTAPSPPPAPTNIIPWYMQCKCRPPVNGFFRRARGVAYCNGDGKCFISPPPPPTCADATTQTTSSPPPLPAHALMDMASQTAMPACVFTDAVSQTSHPQYTECGTQATLMPVPPLTPPARVFADMSSQTPPPPLPARTPLCSESPTPHSPSTREDFDKVLTCLTSLRKEVSPPPSPPPTPRATSPVRHAPSKAGHFHLTIAIPHGLHSLTIDLVDRSPGQYLYREFQARLATASCKSPSRAVARSSFGEPGTGQLALLLKTYFSDVRVCPLRGDTEGPPLSFWFPSQSDISAHLPRSTL